MCVQITQHKLNKCKRNVMNKPIQWVHKLVYNTDRLVDGGMSCIKINNDLMDKLMVMKNLDIRYKFILV